MVRDAGNSCFRIWQFSDTHLFADETAKLYAVNCDDSLQRVIAEALSEGGCADICLFSGDLVHDESEHGYRRLLTYIERLSLPTYCMPGNHDDFYVMQRTLSTRNVSCDEHILIRQWLIILVDTTVDGSNAGHLSGLEYERINNLLQQYPDKHVLLAMHHPPLPTNMAWLDNGVTLDNSERVLSLVAEHPQIRVVIWGHAHQEFQERRDGVLWAGCPSTNAQFRPGVTDFELDNVQPGFRTLDLWDDGRVDSAVIRLP